MSNWTRAHDAWLARECEGLEVIEQDGLYLIFAGWCGKYQQEPEKLFKNVCAYDTDPAAAIRAAEAWRKKEPGRSHHTDSAVDDAFGSKPESACCRRNYHSIVGGGEGPGALAQALYRATGGPA